MTLSQKHCVPCKKGGKALSSDEVQQLSESLPGWKVSEDGLWLHRSFRFSNFVQALAFVNRIGELAEAQGHHPDISLGWGYVNIKLQTHSVGGLHENDFILAAKIDVL